MDAWTPTTRVPVYVGGAPRFEIGTEREVGAVGVANGRLILAAPDLLAACQSICGVYEGQDDVPIYVRKARDAIAKASAPPLAGAMASGRAK